MTYQLRAIKALAAGVYAVTFDDRDALTTLTVTCTIVSHEGILAIQAEPDIFMNSGVPARAVSAAIVAFDYAVRGGDRPPID